MTGAASVHEEIEDMRTLLRAFAKTFEHEHPCGCAQIPRALTATGHKQGCPVDDAVRLDLARMGIV